MNNKIDYNNLEYPVYSQRDLLDFSKLLDPLTLLDKIKKGEITLETAKNYQEVLLENIKPIRKGNKNDEQKRILANINMFHNARNSAIRFIEDYGSMILEAKRLAKEDQKGKGLKISTPNQMLKRLPIALAQVKAGNNSESLLNEIMQIIYSLYRSKEITKKIYNNIINSINV